MVLAVMVGCSGDATDPIASADNVGSDCAQIDECLAGDGCCPASCGYHDDLDCAVCDGSNGLVDPMLTCSVERPCTHLLGTYEWIGVDTLDNAGVAPTCATHNSAVSAGRVAYDDGTPSSWVDQDGLDRWACEFRPEGTASGSKRPLLVYVHGSGGTAASVYNQTSLRTKAIDDDLSGDPARPGFILLSVQGRNLHWVTEGNQDGSKHDAFYRDLSGNRDVAFVDHLIDQRVAEGVVDPDRIYLTGWSNGARFAAFYGIGRRGTATAGGHRVAAVAVYSGGDPYQNIRANHAPSCEQDPYPTAALPFMLVSRTCDAIACDQAQLNAFVELGFEAIPGNVAAPWVATLADAVGSNDVQWLRVTSAGQTHDGCADVGPNLCTTELAMVNHMRWPDGVADKSGTDHEPAMLEFLREHPLR